MRLLRVLLVLAVWTAASPLPPAHALTPPVIDRDRLPVTLYSVVRQPDDGTAHFRGLAE